MGQIKEQTIKGSVYSYLGVLLGFAISGLLLPNLLTTGENGLIKLLIAYSALFAQFATLGFLHPASRLFSYFRDPKTNHHGFVGLTLLVLLAGFVLSMVAFLLLKPNLIKNSIESSELFVNYIGFLIPLIFFSLLYLMLDTYFKMLFKTIIGTFVKEFLLRILILISILLFYLNILSFNEFIIAYVAANCMPGLILLAALFFSEKVNLKPDWKFIDRNLSKSLITMSIYGLLLGFSGIMILNIDSIMISRMVGIEATGVYAITFFFGSLIIIPSRSLRKIAGTILADSWRDNDLKTIASVYQKSSINQLIIGTLIFIGLWGNIHNVFEILPAEYKAGMYVIFFIALTNLVEMTSGVSDILILTSKNYRVGALLNFVFLLMIFIFNYLFIKAFGLVGAAAANTLAFTINSILRYLYIYKRFGMHPFSIQHLYTVVIGVVVYGIFVFFPVLPNFIFDIIVRSSLITMIFIIPVYYFKLSPEINQSIDGFLRLVETKLKSK
ncbi:MAG: polysaccharide biosynthesis protein [Bacteroidetes bacterium HGW-Bacteroidetes-1]|nr:MAG: polysaccharide biosynthesis protein [Bacteroidetes bacterium HGW-Bacteroidetes-1]